MRYITQRHIAAVCCVPFLTLPMLAQADTTELDEVRVSASRTAPQADVQPVGQVNIEREQLDRMPATNLAEALRTIGGVSVRSLFGDGMSGDSSVDIMGFGATAGQNTLILLDGRRLNTVDMSNVQLDAIPLSAIERIEVIPGSGAVLYGNGASGGVVNIVTREHYENAGHIEASAGTYDTHGLEASGSFSKNSLDGLVNVSRLSSDGYRNNNHNRQYNLFSDLRYRHGNASYYVTTMFHKQDLRLPGALGNTLDFGEQFSLTDGLSKTNTPLDYGITRITNVMPGMSYRFNDNVRVHLDAGFRQKKHEAENFGLSTNVDRTLSFSPRLDGRFDLLVPHRWVMGSDVYNTHYHSDNPFLGFERYSRTVKSLYAQDSIGLTDNTWLTLGARHEWVRTEKERGGNLLQDGSRQQVGMWNAGLRHDLSDKVSVFTNLERSARYATVDELRPFGPTVPLKAQTGKVWSTGATWKDDKGQYSTVTVWRAKYNNEIALAPDNSGVVYNRNLEPTKRKGVSLNSYWKLQNNLWLALAGTYQSAHFDGGPNDGRNVPLVPRLSAYARADWTVIPSVTLSLSERYQGSQYMDNDDANNFGSKIAKYNWTDLAVTWRPMGSNGVYVKGMVNNLGNKKGAFDYAITREYITADSYAAYPLPGRHYLVKVGYNF